MLALFTYFYVFLICLGAYWNPAHSENTNIVVVAGAGSLVLSTFYVLFIQKLISDGLNWYPAILLLDEIYF